MNRNACWARASDTGAAFADERICGGAVLDRARNRVTTVSLVGGSLHDEEPPGNANESTLAELALPPFNRAFSDPGDRLHHGGDMGSRRGASARERRGDAAFDRRQRDGP